MSSTTASPPAVLGDRSTNAQVQPSEREAKNEDGSLNKDGEGLIKSMEYHREVLKAKEKGPQQYASPTDDIMSPATAKLSAFKQKKIAAKTKSQTLFQKASAKNLASAKGGNLFEDIAAEKQ